MVLDKVSDFRRYAEGTKSVLNPEHTHPAELAKDVALIVPAGSDAALVSSIDTLCTDRRFKLVRLSPELPDYLRQLDAQTKDCRAICWLLTPTAISAYESPPQVLGRALKIQRLRRGSCTAFLAEGASASGTAMAHRSSRRCVSSVRPRLTTHRATSTSTSTTPTCRSERRRRSGSAAGHDTETTSAESNPGRAEKRALKARFTRFLAAANKALLHPALRKSARSFLKGRRIAVMSSNPCDPAPTSIEAMLSKDLVLQLGSLMTRLRLVGVIFRTCQPLLRSLKPGMLADRGFQACEYRGAAAPSTPRLSDCIPTVAPAQAHSMSRRRRQSSG